MLISYIWIPHNTLCALQIFHTLLFSNDLPGAFDDNSLCDILGANWVCYGTFENRDEELWVAIRTVTPLHNDKTSGQRVELRSECCWEVNTRANASDATKKVVIMYRSNRSFNNTQGNPQISPFLEPKSLSNAPSQTHFRWSRACKPGKWTTVCRQVAIDNIVQSINVTWNWVYGSNSPPPGRSWSWDPLPWDGKGVKCFGYTRGDVEASLFHIICELLFTNQ